MASNSRSFRTIAPLAAGLGKLFGPDFQPLHLADEVANQIQQPGGRADRSKMLQAGLPPSFSKQLAEQLPLQGAIQRPHGLRRLAEHRRGKSGEGGNALGEKQACNVHVQKAVLDVGGRTRVGASQSVLPGGQVATAPRNGWNRRPVLPVPAGPDNKDHKWWHE